MQKDQRGYSVTTDDPIAVEALDHAFNAYTGFRTDSMVHLDAAITVDPQFALPHVIKGLLIAGLKKPELYPMAGDELEAAKNARKPASARENHYMAALEATNGAVKPAVLVALGASLSEARTLLTNTNDNLRAALARQT